MSEYIIKCNIDDDVYNEFLSVLGKRGITPAAFVECAAKELAEDDNDSAEILYDWLKYSSTIQNLQSSDTLFYYLLNVLEYNLDFVKYYEELVRDREARVRWIKNTQTQMDDPSYTEWDEMYTGDFDNPTKLYATREDWIIGAKDAIDSWKEDIAEYTSEINDIWEQYVEWSNKVNPDFDKEIHVIRRYLSDNCDYKIDIKTYRKIRRMTQQELADKIGVTKCTIANYENGRVSLAKIPNSTLQKLADVFEVPVERIV